MKKTLIFSVLVLSFCLLVFSSIATADIPRVINYQGKLTDKEGYALNGTYNVTFRLYDAAAAGNLLWQEVHSSISVQKGLFSVILGSTTPLDLTFDKQYYLSIQVGADPEMTPRQQLASAPYALMAKDSGPTGTIAIWPTDAPPAGWLLCDGKEVSRTTYTELFNVIGTTYGAGDDSGTFNLPDLRGRVPVGKDSMGGISANRVNATEADNLGRGDGEEKHVLTVAEMPSHNHTILSPGGVGGSGRGSFTAGNAPTSYAGGDQPHNNMPPYVTLNYIIKT